MHKLDVLKGELRKVENRIESTVELMIENKLKSLADKLRDYEKKAGALRREIKTTEDNCSVMSVSEEELKRRFAAIRQRLKNGETSNVRQLIEQFVYRVNVYPDRVEVIFNFYPDKVKFIHKSDNEGRADARSSFLVPECVVAETDTKH